MLNCQESLDVPPTLVALWAAWRQKPAATVLACVAAMGLKVWWVDAVVRRTEAGRTGRRSERQQ